jgi:hypothetical protein
MNLQVEQDLTYVAPPTCAAFMKSEAFGRILMGPIGSGKTTACVIELLRRSMEQAPAEDGTRYTRFAVVRQTLRQLKDTVLRDCDMWLRIGDEPLGYWKVSDNTYYLKFHDVYSEWIFIPFEEEADQARLLSMQLTGAFISECIEMDINTLGPISGRMPRYPSGKLGSPTWFGIVADTNFPIELSPWHKFVENPSPNWQVFRQPSGLAPNAENLNWVGQTEFSKKLPVDDPERIKMGRNYYTRLVDSAVSGRGEQDPWVRRYVLAEYGADASGQGVFQNTFQYNFHTVPDTEVIPAYPIIVGQDFGRNPWSLICQVDHMGRLLVHEEVPAENIGLEKQVNQNLKPRLFSGRYLGHRIAVVGDPAGVAKGTIAEESCFDALKRLGLPCFPAPSNLIEPRLRAVEALLGRQTNGGPTLMISRKGAPFLCRAMNGGYRFTKSENGSLRTTPEKDEASHISDALQYVCMIVHGGLTDDIARRLAPRTQRPKVRMTAAAWA